MDKYFPKVSLEPSKAYQISRLFASQIEKIVGQEKMEEAYFKANLNMLISELEQYDTKENIISVINLLDFILFHLKDQNNLLLNFYTKKCAKKYLNISLEKIQYHLIKWYAKKLQNDLDNNLINQKEFEDKLTNYHKKTTKEKVLEKIQNKKIK